MRITSSHGSGGKLTGELIRDVFLKYFKDEALRGLDDGAIFNASGEVLAVTTDCFVVTPIFFPGGDIGKLSVAGTVNDLASMGASPDYLTAGFILQEGLDVQVIERIADSMAETAESVGMRIITADTKVVEKVGDGPAGLFINTTGVGRIYRRVEGIDSLSRGDRIIISGGIAEHGFSVLSLRLKMGDRIKSDCRPLWDMVKAVLDGVKVKFMRDPTRGGISAVMNEIVEGSKLGIVLYEENIPISDEVKGISELLGIMPYEVASEGRMVFIVEDRYAEKTLAILKNHSSGTGAAIIGELVDEPEEKVLIETPYGSRRILSVPIGESLPRIC